MMGDLSLVQQLIAEGEIVDSLDRDGRTPLFHAVGDGKIEIVSELIASGANVNAKGKIKLETPLHFAAQEYRLAIAGRLLRHGAEVDAQDAYGNTPLSTAVFHSSGRGEMIKILLAHGANKNLKNKYGVSPASLAATIANYDMVQFLE